MLKITNQWKFSFISFIQINYVRHCSVWRMFLSSMNSRAMRILHATISRISLLVCNEDNFMLFSEFMSLRRMFFFWIIFLLPIFQLNPRNSINPLKNVPTSASLFPHLYAYSNESWTNQNKFRLSCDAKSQYIYIYLNYRNVNIISTENSDMLFLRHILYTFSTKQVTIFIEFGKQLKWFVLKWKIH